MLPSGSTVASLAAQHPLGGMSMQKKPEQAFNAPKRREPFQAWSAIDDAKTKAASIGKEAAREFELASEKAQQKTGKIEPWSAQYYAACTVGGMLACVGYPCQSHSPHPAQSLTTIMHV
jgi:solute carrier family 25 phosphate transporter 3